MINDILIDRIKLARKIVSDGYATSPEFQTFYSRLENIMKEIFPKNSYSVYTNYGYLYLEFNPTRLLKVGRSKQTDTNLQMIPEEIFMTLLNGMRLIPIHWNVVELNLTKNFVMPRNVFSYIKMLSNIKSSKGAYPVLYRRNSDESVYFSALKRNNREKEFTGKKRIKFYNKKSELIYRHKYISNIKLREKLSESEQKLFGKKYNKDKNTINLKNFNLLRVELTYKGGKNLEKLVSKLSGRTIKGKSPLALSLLMSPASSQSLYSILNQFYEEELKSYIFTDRVVEKNHKSYNAVLSNLLIGDDENIQSELFYIKNILEAADMGKSINAKLRQMSAGMLNHKAYNELYNKIFNNNVTALEEVDESLYRTDFYFAGGELTPIASRDNITEFKEFVKIDDAVIDADLEATLDDGD